MQLLKIEYNQQISTAYHYFFNESNILIIRDFPVMFSLNLFGNDFLNGYSGLGIRYF